MYIRRKENYDRLFIIVLVLLVISIILLITMTIMDGIVQSTHLTLLLINIDFLIDPSKTIIIRTSHSYFYRMVNIFYFLTYLSCL